MSDAKPCSCDPRHEVTVEIPGVYDGGLFFECWRPDGGCGARWHRLPPGHPLRMRAEPYVPHETPEPSPARLSGDAQAVS